MSRTWFPTALILIILLNAQAISSQISISYRDMRVTDMASLRPAFKLRFDQSEYNLVPVQDAQGRFGFMQAFTHDTLVPCRYDSVASFDGDRAAVRRNGKWGFVNRFGREVVPCRYDSLAGSYNRDRCFVRNNGRVGCIDDRGAEVLPCEFDELFYAAEELLWGRKKNKYGLFSLQGKPLTQLRFDAVRNFSQERAWVMIEDKWGFINSDGVLLISPRYLDASDFVEGRAVVREQELYGFVNRSGEPVIPCLYQNAHDFSEGLAAVQFYGGHWAYIDTAGVYKINQEGTVLADNFRNGYARIARDPESRLLFGLIRKDGSYLIPCEYEAVGEVSDSMVAVQQNGRWGYCNLEGKQVISCRFEEAYNFYDGEAEVSSGDSYFINKKGEYLRKTNAGMEEETASEEKNDFLIHYINSRGERVIQGQPGLESSLFFNGMAPVRKNGQYGFMNPQGVLAIPCRYDSAGSFSEGLAPVRKNGKWGYIFQDGDTLTGFEFDYAYGFYKGLAVVKKDGRYGQIDKTGKWYIPNRYDMSYAFSDSLALVREGSLFGFINKKGETVIPCQYEDAYSFSASSGLAAVQKNGRWGYIDRTGQERIPCRYEMALGFSEGMAAVMKERRWGYIDTEGRIVLPFRYQMALPFSQGTALALDLEKEWQLIDKKGEDIFGDGLLSQFYENRALIADEKGKLGFIDRQGKIAVPCRYDDALPFQEGLAPVAIGGKWGFINTSGTVVIPLQFDMTLPFHEGLAPVINLPAQQ